MHALLGKPFMPAPASGADETASPEGSEKSFMSDDAYSSDDQSDAEESDWQVRPLSPCASPYCTGVPCTPTCCPLCFACMEF
jgi:hypothetical protein